jgi:Photosynthetic reaction centre cytochrome C subunit
VSRNFAASLAATFLFSISTLILTAGAQDAKPATSPSANQQGQGQARPRRTITKPTNLQVLPRDIAVPDLLAMMRGFTGALGVECEFCHTRDPQTHRPDYASDANPDKAIARTMIAMTNEINAKYLSQVKDPDATPADKTVTCGTCHRGNSMPKPFGAAGAMGEHHDHPPAPPPDQKPQ